MSSEIQKQLAQILQREVNITPNVGLVSISKVEISPDLYYAKIYLTFLDVGSSADLSNQAKVDAIAKHTPYIRALLGKAVKLRVVPELKFIYDDANDKLDHMNRILNSLKN